MKFCTMCGEQCANDTALENHEHLHRSEGLPVLNVREAFQRAFQRAPSLLEQMKIADGLIAEVFEKASATLS